MKGLPKPTILLSLRSCRSLCVLLHRSLFSRTSNRSIVAVMADEATSSSTTQEVSAAVARVKELEQEIHRSTVHLNNLVPLLAACEVPDALALYISIARCSQN